MMRQYNRIKQQHPNALVFFRLGDFYEMFGDDAVLASKELEITLTSRESGKGNRIPMCGVPYHAVDRYLAQLMEKGYKVAICDQVEDPKEAKGLVEREVTRVVTPGTIYEQELLDEHQNNYLIAVCGSSSSFGLAYVDVSTGEYAACSIQESMGIGTLIDELYRLNPAEGLVDSKETLDRLVDLLPPNWRGRFSVDEARLFSGSRGEQALLDHFEVQNLAGFGCGNEPLLVTAAGALLLYVQDNHRQSLGHITSLRVYNTAEHMLLDRATRRNLELTQTMREGKKEGSLLWAIDRTSTSMGARTLAKWINQPLIDQDDINRRQELVEQLVQDMGLRERVRSLLRRVYDLERLAAKVNCGSANGRDLLSLCESLKQLPSLIANLMEAGGLLADLGGTIDPLEDVHGLLETSIGDNPPVSITEGDLIKTGYNAEVDELRVLAAAGDDWVAAFEQQERERTGIKSLKVGHNRVFGYYIEVTKANLHLVPEDYTRKQTLVNSERFITPELKSKETQIFSAKERLMELEYTLFVEIRSMVAEQVSRIQHTAAVIAQLDVLTGFAQVAVEHDYCRPVVDDSDRITLKECRHPVVERLLKNQTFVPNDVDLNGKQQFVILTGPNMAGKSTYLRQVALAVLLAQIGSFVPANEAHIGVVDRIFTRVGASDDLGTGQSTFMVEMTEVANILNNATEQSLIILDEVGRGTSTYDGLSIAWAVSEYIHSRIGAKTLFATHYHELTELTDKLERAANFRVAVAKEGKRVVFLHSIVPGSADKSYGIEVARLAGLPEEVLTRAGKLLKNLERKAPGSKEVAAASEPVAQLSLFYQRDPLVEELSGLDLNQMRPIDALNTLFRLQEMARRTLGGKQ
jgi:DNA mismatch repair protein MutS